MSDKKTGIDKGLIRDLANILNETDLTEIEVEQDDLRIRVSRAGTPQYVQAAAPAPAAAPVQINVPAASSVAVADATPKNSKNTVKAPMVGTCYLASGPGAAPFVSEGTVVKEGQTLLIIEAMKTMNQIPAPRAGKVTAIYAEDGQPVEYGQPLFEIE